EMRAKAFAEMERTRRVGMGVEFGRYAFEALVGSLIPVANRLVEVLGNRNVTVFPEFRTSQQAMAYLVLDVTPFQLKQMFNDDPEVGGAFLARLDAASRMQNERDAIGLLASVRMLPVLRSENFRAAATAEQQLAARFIIGRAAMLIMAEYGEDAEA